MRVPVGLLAPGAHAPQPEPPRLYAVPPHTPADEKTPGRAQRARGRVSASFRGEGGRTRLTDLAQSGSSKLRLPRLPLANGGREAILINTAGGLTGGDRFAQGFDVGPGADLTVSTQACERIYRALAGEAEVETRLAVSGGGRLAWLPQETILFDGGRLSRRIEVDLAQDARLLLCEAVILGREHMGESVREGRLAERWRVRVDGRLAFADALRLDEGFWAAGAAAAGLAGARAFATLLFVGPNAEAQLPWVRASLNEGDAVGGASLVGGVLVVRLAAPGGAALRRRLVPLLETLAGGPLPRVWSL